MLAHLQSVCSNSAPANIACVNAAPVNMSTPSNTAPTDTMRATAFAHKRRLLREHRTQMRIMDHFVLAGGLSDSVDRQMIFETGNTAFWLGYDKGPGGMDESSDEEDPQAKAEQLIHELRREAADQQAFVAAVQGALDSRTIVTDLEQSRMFPEDEMSARLRGCQQDHK